MILLLSFAEADLIVDALSVSNDPLAPVIIDRIKDCEALQVSQHRVGKRRKGERTWTREKQKEACRKYRESHREQIRERALKRYQENKDKPEFKEKRRQYNKKANDKLRADPVKLEARREYFRQYYQRKKSEQLSRNNLENEKKKKNMEVKIERIDLSVTGSELDHEILEFSKIYISLMESGEDYDFVYILNKKLIFAIKWYDTIDLDILLPENVRYYNPRRDFPEDLEATMFIRAIEGTEEHFCHCAKRHKNMKIDELIQNFYQINQVDIDYILQHLIFIEDLLRNNSEVKE